MIFLSSKQILPSGRGLPLYSVHTTFSVEQNHSSLIQHPDDHQVGYAFTHVDDTMLTISNLVLQQGTDSVEAIAAVAAEFK